MSKAIAVVIPHLNQPELLAKCLASLAAQTLARDQFEIVVVDNGSRDMPQALCDSFGARLLVEPTPGPGPARNTGIAGTSAEKLAFIDADCVAHPDWLAVAHATLVLPDVTVIGGDVRIGYVNPQELTPLECYESIFAFRQRDYIERQGFSGTGNLAFWRKTYTEVGPFGGIAIAEDREWGQRAGAKGFITRYVPEMIVWHPARTSLKDIKAKWRRHIAHDYANVRGPVGFVKWCARAIAIAGSPLRDTFVVLMSDRLSGLANRSKAISMLLATRLYRGWYMLRIPFRSNVTKGPQWNADPPKS